MSARSLADSLDRTADECRSADDVADWLPEDYDVVLDSLGGVAREVPALSARIRAARALLASGQRECDDPPDLDGLCYRCGRQIAPPVTGHKQGCNPLSLLTIPLARVRRVSVRTARLVGCLRNDLKGGK